MTALDKYDVGDSTLYIKVTMTAFRIEGQATGYTVGDDAAWVEGSVWVYAVICLGTCARTGITVSVFIQYYNIFCNTTKKLT